MRGKNSWNRDQVPPNRLEEATRVSPWESRPRRVPDTAAMPVEKATVPMPPSRLVRRCSKAVRVGLVMRL
jgi:hypothetical protein